ncbi:MAG TPA: hypothetical protein VGB85_08230 [Nannocystis sp.]|jgi:hypothetical protein
MTRKLALCLALVFTTRTAQGAAPTAEAAPVSVDAALASGDLTAAREQAEAARKASPGAASWAAEAEVCERLADLACAKAARTQQRELTAAGSPERAAVEAKLAVLEDMSRGTVADEPRSKHRAELDRARSGRDMVAVVKPRPDIAPSKPVPPRERIVTKWYFWVTLGAIAASAVAITVIGVKAAADEQSEKPEASAGRVRPGSLDHGFGIRF